MLTNNEFITTHLVVHRSILQALFAPITDEQRALFESERQKTLQAIRAGL